MYSIILIKAVNDGSIYETNFYCLKYCSSLKIILIYILITFSFKSQKVGILRRNKNSKYSE